MWTDQELDAESLSTELHKGSLACLMFAPRCTSAAMVTSGPIHSASKSRVGEFRTDLQPGREARDQPGRTPRVETQQAGKAH